MSKIYNNILRNKAANKKMLAVLLDPDKCKGQLLVNVKSQLRTALPDFIFIGGSAKNCPSEDLLVELQDIPVPKILFPGDASQFCPKADGLLLLSLISGRNPVYLIGQHVKTALYIKKSKMDVMPTGYILIDGGTESSVVRVSGTEPISAENSSEAIATAVAGELLGMKLIYLEAGSGAKNPVPLQMISEVKNALDIPLIVGGGIKTIPQLKSAYGAGADIVVVGNIFESETDRIGEFVRELNKVQ